jgi:putative methanogenesis marker protein 6
MKMKETCFGLIIEGEKNAVREALQKIRDLDKHHIFSKVRAYPPGDPRICRANRGGGPRPGFHFIEFEHQLLPLVGAALESLEEKEKVTIAKPPEEKIVPIQVIRKLIKKYGQARRS